MIRSASLGLIALYQRHLSPRKGYVCALRASGGGLSCSSYAARAIARGGVLVGVGLAIRRLKACALAGEGSAEPRADDQLEVKFFGGCAPAVTEGRKLCCGSLIGGMLSGGERGG